MSWEVSSEEAAGSDSDASSVSDDSSSCLPQASWSLSVNDVALTPETGGQPRGPPPPAESGTPPRTPLRAVENEEAYQSSLQRLRQTVAARISAGGGRKTAPTAKRYETPQSVVTASTSSPCSPEEGAAHDLLRLSMQTLADTEGGAEDWLTGPAPQPLQPAQPDPAPEAASHEQPAAIEGAADAAAGKVAELEGQVAELEAQQSVWERQFVEDVEVEVERRLALER